MPRIITAIRLCFASAAVLCSLVVVAADGSDAEAEPARKQKPLVEVGQQAPPLAIGRWLDGTERSLAGLRGRVVVLNFWGLWCGGCRAEAPELKALQRRFRDQPVTFISIHNAEEKQDDLAARIEAFQKKNDLHWIGAIDAGAKDEDSETISAYGVIGFPLMVIVGTDGKIVYVDFMAETPDNDQPAALAALEKKVNDVMKHQFESVGETWPISEKLDEKAQNALRDRVIWKFISQQIESALSAKRRTAEAPARR